MCGIEIPQSVLAPALAVSLAVNLGLFLILRWAWKEDAKWRR